MSNDLPIYKPSEVLNLFWIRQQEIEIEVLHEKKYYRQFWIVDKYRKQLKDLSKPDLVKVIAPRVRSLDKRKLYRWYEAKYNFLKIYSKAGKRFLDSLPEGGVEEFTVNLYRGSKLIGVSTLSYDIIRSTTLADSAPPVAAPKVLNVAKVIKKREDLLAPVEYIEFKDEEDKEDLIISICEEVATGLYTITEICERHNLPYLQFIEILSSNNFARQTYSEAIQINNTIQSSRQLTLVDQKLISLLATGKHTTITVHQKKKTRPDTLLPEWVDDRRSVTERDLTPAELLTIKMALVRSWELGSMLAPDEFNEMDDADLMRYVNANYKELDGTRGEANILEASRRQDKKYLKDKKD